MCDGDGREDRPERSPRRDNLRFGMPDGAGLNQRRRKAVERQRDKTSGIPAEPSRHIPQRRSEKNSAGKKRKPRKPAPVRRRIGCQNRAAMPATAPPTADRAGANVRCQTRCRRLGKDRWMRQRWIQDWRCRDSLPCHCFQPSPMRSASLPSGSRRRAQFGMHQPQGLCQKAQQQQSSQKLRTSEAFAREIWRHKVEPSVLPCRRQFAGKITRTFCNERSRNQHGRVRQRRIRSPTAVVGRSGLRRRNSAFLRPHAVSWARWAASRLGIRFLRCHVSIRCRGSPSDWRRRRDLGCSGLWSDAAGRIRQSPSPLLFPRSYLPESSASVGGVWICPQASLRTAILGGISCGDLPRSAC